LTASNVWKAAAVFRASGPPHKPRESAVVLDFKHLRHPPPEAIVEMRFVEGLLAVHQLGAFRGLLHPFMNAGPEPPSGREALIWHERDDGWALAGERPFPPRAVPGLRHVLFAAPHGVNLVDVWGLKDWSVQPAANSRSLIRCDDSPDVRVAAPPLAFDDQTIGLVLGQRSSSSYRWYLYDLGRRDAPISGREAWAQAAELAVQGEPCQLLTLPGEVVAFSTPREQWIWPWPDARRGQADSLNRIQQADQGKEVFLLDQEVLHEKDFSRRKQFLQSFSGPVRAADERTRAGGCGARSDAQQGNASAPELRTYSWYYLRETADGVNLGQHRVSIRGSQVTAQHVEPDPHDKRSSPLGPHEEQRAEMLLLRGTQLVREAISSGTTRPVDPAWSVGNVQELIGLVFRSPILMMIRDEGRQLSIHSLAHLRHEVKLQTSPLYSNPLIWSQWLFTLELEQDRLVLRRRDLQAAC
jgi:hypothetical protein